MNIGEKVVLAKKERTRKKMTFGGYLDVTAHLMPDVGDHQEGEVVVLNVKPDSKTVRLVMNAILEPGLTQDEFDGLDRSEWTAVMGLFKEGADEYKATSMDQEKKTC